MFLTVAAKILRILQLQTARNCEISNIQSKYINIRILQMLQILHFFYNNRQNIDFYSKNNKMYMIEKLTGKIKLNIYLFYANYNIVNI